MDEEYLEVFCHKCKTNSVKLGDYRGWHRVHGGKLICNECSPKWSQEVYQRVKEELKMKESLKQAREELELLELKKKDLTKHILEKTQNID